MIVGLLVSVVILLFVNVAVFKRREMFASLHATQDENAKLERTGSCGSQATSRVSHLRLRGFPMWCSCGSTTPLSTYLFL